MERKKETVIDTKKLMKLFKLAFINGKNTFSHVYKKVC